MKPSGIIYAIIVGIALGIGFGMLDGAPPTSGNPPMTYNPSTNAPVGPWVIDAAHGGTGTSTGGVVTLNGTYGSLTIAGGANVGVGVSGSTLTISGSFIPLSGGTGTNETFNGTTTIGGTISGGTFSGGLWNGTAIGDTYISSASTWNAIAGRVTGSGTINLSTSGTTTLPGGAVISGSGNIYGRPLAVVTSTGTTNSISNGIYIANVASGTAPILLPTGAPQGSRVQIVGANAGQWKLAQNASQVIHFNSTTTTTGTAGYLTSQNGYNCIEVMCVSTDGNTWVVITNEGSLNFN